MSDESPVRSYKDLEVWRVAMDLAVACYKATSTFPREETYGLTAQIRRSAVSIAANMAEGYGRETTSSFVHFLRIAQGSLEEVETHLSSVERVEIRPAAPLGPLFNLCERVSKMLRNPIRSLEKQSEAER